MKSGPLPRGSGGQGDLFFDRGIEGVESIRLKASEFQSPKKSSEQRACFLFLIWFEHILIYLRIFTLNAEKRCFGCVVIRMLEGHGRADGVGVYESYVNSHNYTILQSRNWAQVRVNPEYLRLEHSQKYCSHSGPETTWRGKREI